MMFDKRKKDGFTLVELAIVITIIGLLIGGVLKGQELLQNSRMTSMASQVRSISAATTTFRDVYKALPGDILNPANFIQNCTASPCNISGDNNGVVGVLGGVGNENNNFWLHMSKAGLIAGIDPNSTWTVSAPYQASMPSSPLGGILVLHELAEAVSSTVPNGMRGRYVVPFAMTGGGTGATPVVPNNVIGKYDLKIDDGKPWTGIVLYRPVDVTCSVASGATVYDPNNTTLCYPYTAIES